MVTWDEARGQLALGKGTDAGYLLLVSQQEFEEEGKGCF